MIAVRLRTRDGLERIQVEQTASLSTLKDLISQKVERPLDQLSVSTDQTLVSKLLTGLLLRNAGASIPAGVRCANNLLLCAADLEITRDFS